MAARSMRSMGDLLLHLQSTYHLTYRLDSRPRSATASIEGAQDKTRKAVNRLESVSPHTRQAQALHARSRPSHNPVRRRKLHSCQQSMQALKSCTCTHVYIPCVLTCARGRVMAPDIEVASMLGLLIYQLPFSKCGCTPPARVAILFFAELQR